MANDSRRNVAMTFGTNLGLAGMNAVTGVVLARMLGPTLRGEFQASQLWMLFLGTIAPLGVQEAVVYYVSRRRQDAGSIVFSAMAFTLLTSLLVTAIGLLIVPWLLGSQTEQVKDLARVFLLVIPVFALAGIPMQALRAIGAFGWWNVLRVLPSALWLVVVVGSSITDRLSVATLVAGYMTMLVVLFVVINAVAVPKFRRPRHVQPELWPPMLRFGLPGVLATVPHVLNINLDQFLLAAFVSAEDLGLYVVGVAWAGAMAPLLSSLGPVLFPRLAGEESFDERMRVMAKGFRSAVVVAIGAVLVVLVCTVPGIRILFGTDYLPAVPAALVLVVAAGVLAMVGVLQDGFRGLGRPSEVLWSEIMGLVSTVVGLVALLPLLGILGAGLASLLGYSTTVTMLLFRLRRSTGATEPIVLRPGGEDVREVLRSIREVSAPARRRLRAMGRRTDRRG